MHACVRSRAQCSADPFLVSLQEREKHRSNYISSCIYSRSSTTRAPSDPFLRLCRRNLEYYRAVLAMAPTVLSLSACDIAKSDATRKLDEVSAEVIPLAL